MTSVAKEVLSETFSRGRDPNSEIKTLSEQQKKSENELHQLSRLRQTTKIETRGKSNPKRNKSQIETTGRRKN